MEDQTTPPARRSFCVNTTIDPEHFFYVDPSLWNEENLVRPLLNGSWLTMLAPSQSGKSTRAIALVTTLKGQDVLPI